MPKIHTCGHVIFSSLFLITRLGLALFDLLLLHLVTVKHKTKQPCAADHAILLLAN